MLLPKLCTTGGAPALATVCPVLGQLQRMPFVINLSPCYSSHQLAWQRGLVLSSSVFLYLPCHLILLAPLNTYPPPQLIWPTPLSQRWKQSNNSTFDIINSLFLHVNKPFSTYHNTENMKKSIELEKETNEHMVLPASPFHFIPFFSWLSKVDSWTLVGRSRCCFFHFLVIKQSLQKKTKKKP